ncbi:MAG: DUF493 domain-containing protein [Syntrophales bacterium]
MMEQNTILHFPCAYPLKIMGNNSEAFAAAVQIICEKYVSPDQIHYSRRLSKGDKYLSITATCIVQSKKQLDQIYQELKAQELVLFAL